MGWWQRLRNAVGWNTSAPRRTGNGWFYPASGGAGQVPVDARAVPAVYAAVRLLTNTLSDIEPAVYRPIAGMPSEYEPVPRHPLTAMLRRPSRHLDPRQFWQLLWARYLMQGNAYAYIVRRGGVPVELIPCTVENARIEHRGSLMQAPMVYRDITFFEYGFASTRHFLPGVPDSSLLCLHGPGFDGIASPSPIEYAARRAMQTLAAAAERNTAGLVQGAHIDKWIYVPEALAEIVAANGMDRLREQIDEVYSGPQQAGKIPAMPPGLEIRGVSGATLSSVDLQLIEVMRFSLEDVCRIFDTPPQFLYQFEKGVRLPGQLAAQREAFRRQSIQPPASCAGAQSQVKLMPARTEQRVRWDTSRLSWGTLSDRADIAERLAARGGLMTINEARALLQLPPVEDGGRLLPPKGSPPPDTKGEPAQDPPMEEEDEEPEAE